ncbi:hypothetical protein JW905_13650 [bacterium]|nr:hypothetical protein [candidate division CSSED10-310 bacterium]
MASSGWRRCTSPRRRPLSAINPAPWTPRRVFVVALGNAHNDGWRTTPGKGGSMRDPGTKMNGMPAPGSWRTDVWLRLREIVTSAPPDQRMAVFDFDNTLGRFDIGEETCACLVKEGLIKTFSRRFWDLQAADDERPQPTWFDDYYQRLANLRDHSGEQADPGAAYAWCVQIMAGLDAASVVECTGRAFDRLARRLPSVDQYFFPEMVELLCLLVNTGFRCCIVSSTNTWSVRWLVRTHLNPLLARRCRGRCIDLSDVRGISVLLVDRRTGAITRDAELLRRDEGYDRLDMDSLRRYRLTAHLDFPVPVAHGKATVVNECLSCSKPWLAVGDSLNDLAMLQIASYRLWLAWMDKPEVQRPAGAVIGLEPGAWLVQPVIGKPPRFYTTEELATIDQQSGEAPAAPEVRLSRTLLGF